MYVGALYSLPGPLYSLSGLCIVCRGFVKFFGASPSPQAPRRVDIRQSRQRDTETERRRDRETERQRDRETQRQRHRDTERH